MHHLGWRRAANGQPDWKHVCEVYLRRVISCHFHFLQGWIWLSISQCQLGDSCALLAPSLITCSCLREGPEWRVRVTFWSAALCLPAASMLLYYPVLTHHAVDVFPSFYYEPLIGVFGHGPPSNDSSPVRSSSVSTVEVWICIWNLAYDGYRLLIRKTLSTGSPGFFLVKRRYQDHHDISRSI